MSDEPISSTSSDVSVPRTDDPILPPTASFWGQLMQPLRHSVIMAGLLMTLASALVFILCDRLSLSDDQYFTLFLFHYGFALSYGLILMIGWIARRRKKEPATSHQTSGFWCWLVMSLISCYALNRMMGIFQQSTPWLTIYLITSSIACLLLIWKEMLPAAAKNVLYFFLAVALVLFVYLSLYLIAIYPLGAIAMIAIGVGGHTFIPLFFSIALSRHLWKAAIQTPRVRLSIIAGIAFPLLFTTYFLIHWSHNLKQISQVENRLYTHPHDLPNWVLIAQPLQNDWITERILKSGLIYKQDIEDSFWRFSPSPLSMQLEHDPLVVLASTIVGKVSMDDKDKVQVLKSLYDLRHEAEPKLWRDDHLTTSHVHTQVKVYPSYRMAYTEKIIAIANTKASWREERQEALYTFHLPEGSVVTSLSLWVNGIEQPARLTTQAKADSAYSTIVGVEQRDPSVVHWQEGNIVTVRVFPCTPTEKRRFKIGITSPLRAEGSLLHYDNIYFQGPTTVGAEEDVRIELADHSSQILGLDGFTPTSDLVFELQDTYNPNRHFSLQAPTLSQESFAFGGKNYTLRPYQKTYETFTPQTVYLDVNQAWTLREFEEVMAAVQGKKVRVWDQQQWIDVTTGNAVAVYEKAWKNRFTLFPFHAVPDLDKALVISKSDFPTPTLTDLQDTPFAKSITENAKPVRLFNLGHELSPFLRTFLELRLLHYDNGNTRYLSELLHKQTFVKDQEDAHTVVLPQSALTLTEAPATQTNVPSQAPDHLMRLYAYNHLMQQIGQRYFEKNFLSDKLIAEAQQAYVVSPISSLIVLETEQDYKRFGIDEAKNSLQNASLNGSGSVPEPHEWLLILTFVSVVLVMWWRNR